MLVNKIKEYLDEKITLSQLEDWEAERALDFISDPNSRDADLAAAIELCLAEYQAGIRNEADIRQFLYAEINQHTIRVNFPSEMMTGSSTPVTRKEYIYRPETDTPFMRVVR